MSAKNSRTSRESREAWRVQRVELSIEDLFAEEYVAPLELPIWQRIETERRSVEPEPEPEPAATPRAIDDRELRQAEIDSIEALDRLQSRRDGPFAGVRRKLLPLTPRLGTLARLALVGGVALAALLVAKVWIRRA